MANAMWLRDSLLARRLIGPLADSVMRMSRWPNGESFVLEQPDVGFDRFPYVVKPAVVAREPEHDDPVRRFGEKGALFFCRGVRYEDRAIKDEERPAVILQPGR